MGTINIDEIMKASTANKAQLLAQQEAAAMAQLNQRAANEAANATKAQELGYDISRRNKIYADYDAEKNRGLEAKKQLEGMILAGQVEAPKNYRSGYGSDYDAAITNPANRARYIEGQGFDTQKRKAEIYKTEMEGYQHGLEKGTDEKMQPYQKYSPNAPKTPSQAALDKSRDVGSNEPPPRKPGNGQPAGGGGGSAVTPGAQAVMTTDQEAKAAGRALAAKRAAAVSAPTDSAIVTPEPPPPPPAPAPAQRPGILDSMINYGKQAAMAYYGVRQKPPIKNSIRMPVTPPRQ